jgi:hypothetical protein
MHLLLKVGNKNLVEKRELVDPWACATNEVQPQCCGERKLVLFKSHIIQSRPAVWTRPGVEYGVEYRSTATSDCQHSVIAHWVKKSRIAPQRRKLISHLRSDALPGVRVLPVARQDRVRTSTIWQSENAERGAELEESRCVTSSGRRNLGESHL